MGKLSNYIKAVRMVHSAHKRSKNGEIISLELKKSMPVYEMSSWGATMEACLFHGDYRKFSAPMGTVFKGLDKDIQRKLTFTPKTQGEWVERAKFWQRELKPVLSPHDYYAAMSRILKWYIHCIRDIRGGAAV